MPARYTMAFVLRCVSSSAEIIARYRLGLGLGVGVGVGSGLGAALTRHVAKIIVRYRNVALYLLC